MDRISPTRNGSSILVLGAGLVGGFIAGQLARDGNLAVTVVDLSSDRLRQLEGHGLNCIQADLSDRDVLSKQAAEADLVVGAVPGHMGYRTLETVISCAKDCIDISFFPEDPAPLDALARHHGVRVICDCGVMPGLGGMLAHHLAGQLDRTLSLKIMVGGLPVERIRPFEYKAPFSPADVIEEYTRPARLVRNGRMIELPALSEVEEIEFRGIGTLEAFNTDGLRSLLSTLPLPDMVEKTLRYPGTARTISLLKQLGLFSTETLLVRGNPVQPLELTSQLLFREWQLRPGDREFTAMAIEVCGQQHGAETPLTATLLDYSNPETGDFSMARTTGLPAVIASRMLLTGELDRLLATVATGDEQGSPYGCFAPDWLGSDPAVFKAMLEQLAESGIEIRFTGGPCFATGSSHFG